MLFWPEFRRDTSLPDVNALLNYGYTVLRAAALAEVCRALTVQAPIPLAASAANASVSSGRPRTSIAVAHARRPWREAANAGPHGLLSLREQIAD